MEVHHHTHAAGKKWTHYFWEFLMLFLAVFCGFLAEYQLEHTIEHKREAQFMSSLVEDLTTDTTELRKALQKCDTVARFSDSVLFFLATYKIGDKLPSRFAAIIGTAGQNQFLINTDRTSSQLKNSGAMRLVRKKNVSDAILQYWKQIEITQISLDRYMKYRDAGRSLVFKLWVIPEVYKRSHLLYGDVIPDSLQMLRVIDTDHKKWDELSNLIAISGSISRQAHSLNLKNQKVQAKDLIDLLKREYHLK
jgi:hypothetical protein